MKHSRVTKCVQQYLRLLRFTGKLIKQITVVPKSQLDNKFCLKTK